MADAVVAGLGAGGEPVDPADAAVAVATVATQPVFSTCSHGIRRTCPVASCSVMASLGMYSTTAPRITAPERSHTTCSGVWVRVDGEGAGALDAEVGAGAPGWAIAPATGTIGTTTSTIPSHCRCMGRQHHEPASAATRSCLRPSNSNPHAWRADL